ncbi:MAG TPA: hypothetical protein VIV11_00960 [Kofleriaceae bacterium]
MRNITSLTFVALTVLTASAFAQDAPAKDPPAKDPPAKDAPAKAPLAPAKDAPAKAPPAKAPPAKAPPSDAAAKDAPAPEATAALAKAIVVHVAPTTTVAGKPIELEAMIDAPFAEQLSVRWRAIGQAQWQDIPFERSSAGGWFASLPAAASPGVEYYIRGADPKGSETAHFATEQAPHVVRVDPSLFDRLESLDRERLGGNLDELSLDVIAHDFGNRYEIPDWFVRSELTYTHNLLRVLHQVGFGFGSINGRTPVDRMEGGRNEWHALNYGYGQIRMRVHPSVFLDGRVGLGVSHENFVGLGRGSVTFGKPWRSCVTVGGEYFGDIGPSGWVRLQWDTAWPLLMGASIVRSDLPGALVEPAGLYIAYDVSLQMANRFTLKAQLSYGARDGAAHPGGGIGTAVAF